jgi:hypothetical protein
VPAWSWIGWDDKKRPQLEDALLAFNRL